MRCEGRIWRDWHFVQCLCEAKVNRDGKGYCGTHDPVRRKEKVAARDARWAKEREEQAARWKAQCIARDRAALCVAACSTLTDIGVSELGRLLSALPSLRAMLYNSVHDGSPEILLIENLITHIGYEPPQI